MKDSEFKKLNHLAKGYKMHSNGKFIEKNYSPDFSFIKEDSYILIEHESEPNRKTIVADMIKAAHFLQGNKIGILVIVMTPKGTSSLKSYSKHIHQYLYWIQDKTNLKEVFFISEADYLLNEVVLEINTKRFNELCIKIDCTF